MSDEKKVPSKFIENVKNWVLLDDKINQLKNEIKNLTTEKKENEIEILEGLDKLEENTISIKDGKIKKNILKSQGPIKKELIHKSIFDLIKDEQKTQDILTKINNSRPIVNKINLKRVKNKNTTDKIFEKVNQDDQIV
jgi:septal ring factor EnvC (AmiA/AmiB activator)